MSDRVDLRLGLNTGKPVGVTNLFDHGWTPPALVFGNDQLEEVIRCLEHQMMMATIGVDELNAAEKFALTILIRQYKYMTGESLTTE
jgi:hypothetical protein